jgi:hypothetical protein
MSVCPPISQSRPSFGASGQAEQDNERWRGPRCNVETLQEVTTLIHVPLDLLKHPRSRPHRRQHRILGDRAHDGQARHPQDRCRRRHYGWSQPAAHIGKPQASCGTAQELKHRSDFRLMTNVYTHVPGSSRPSSGGSRPTI